MWFKERHCLHNTKGQVKQRVLMQKLQQVSQGAGQDNEGGGHMRQQASVRE